MGRRAIQKNRRGVATNRRARGRSAGPPSCCCGTGEPCTFTFGPTCPECVGGVPCARNNVTAHTRICTRTAGGPTICTTISWPVSICCGTVVGMAYSGSAFYQLYVNNPAGGCPEPICAATSSASGPVSAGGTVTATTIQTVGSGPPQCTTQTFAENPVQVGVTCLAGGNLPLGSSGVCFGYPLLPINLPDGTFVETLIPGSFQELYHFQSEVPSGLGNRTQRLYFRQTWGPTLNCGPGPLCPPRGACCCGDQCFSQLTAAECASGQGTWLGPGSTCAGCLGACCIPDLGCIQTSRPACTTLGGAWLGGSCEGVNCDQLFFGACCNPATGECEETTAGLCLSPRTFLGVGSVCGGFTTQGQPAPNPCPVPTGRCCIPNGSGGFNCLSNYTQAQCNAAFGQWGGYQSNCTVNPCPPSSGGACCVFNGTTWDCIQVPDAKACAAAGGIFTGSPDCQAVDCTQYNGACCTMTSHGMTCSVVPQSSCSGIWHGAGTNCSSPTICGGGTTESPLLGPEAFQSFRIGAEAFL